jgi:hypothetical protein
MLYNMKRAVISVFILFTCHLLIFCQDTDQNKVTLGVSSGFIKYTTSDQLLNYYNYSQNAFLPVKLMGFYSKNKNLIFIHLLYNQTKLYPKDVHNDYYEYNYIKHWNIESSLEYDREIVQMNNKIRAYIGIGNNSYIVIQKEYFKNLLYDDAGGYRKSYDFTMINISPDFMVDCNLHKNYICIKTGYTLLNIAARPDDNEVKQIGQNSRIHWKTYSIKNYKGFHLSLFYQYRISKNIGLTAEYALVYHSYLSPVEYKYLSKSFLIGISKTF